MSYILEALRRAERERQMGKVPSVESLTQNHASTPSAVPLRVWLLGGATALIAVAALALLLWPKATPPASPAPAPLAAAAPLPAPVVHRAPSPTPTAIEDDSALASLDDVAEPEAAPADGSTAAPLQPQDVAQDAAPEPGSTVIRPNMAPTVAPAQVPAPTPAPASPATGAVAMPGGVTLLREMPDTYRAQFPVTSLDVHVYDPEPARRWVMIGGRRYREGEIVAGGPRVAQITDAGVIFDYNGAQVLLPVR